MLIAYHGNPAIKRKYIARVERHRKAAHILQGYDYWKDGRGCAVGCSIHGSSHEAYELELGIPALIAHLEDSIFEALPEARAQLWPSAFLRAIQPGADLSLVWPQFAVWMLTDPRDGVLQLALGRSGYENAIRGVSDLYVEWVGGGKKPGGERFAEAARTAWVAQAAGAVEAAKAEWAVNAAGTAEAAVAARTAEAAWAAEAARAARTAWAVEAARAVEAVEAARTAEAARAVEAVEAARTAERQANKLLELLRAARSGADAGDVG
jgi:hypothetical protein